MLLPADLSSKDVSNTSFTLTWSYDETALGDPTNLRRGFPRVLSHFIIQFKEVTDTDWKPPQVAGPDMHELTINNLQPSTEYNVSIAAWVHAEADIGLVDEKLTPDGHWFVYMSKPSNTTVTTREGGMCGSYLLTLIWGAC